MAASDESEHVTHYVVWLCVAIFAYIPRHPRHSFCLCIFVCPKTVPYFSLGLVWRRVVSGLRPGGLGGYMWYDLLVCGCNFLLFPDLKFH